MPEAWHTKQNVYIVDVTGSKEPKELTSGKQAAVHSPVLNAQATKAAWLELDEDGYESDRSVFTIIFHLTLGQPLHRAKIVIYDLEKGVRYTLTQGWDRSPDGLVVSPWVKFYSRPS